MMMGYTTEFMGEFKFDKQLTIDQLRELEKMCPPTRHSESTHPGYYCKWTPTEDGRGLEWNGMEKFYDYVEWLKHIIKYKLNPWGITLNGDVAYSGKEVDDNGTISVKGNVVTVLKNGPVSDLVAENEALRKRIAELEGNLIDIGG
jgi:hypothetical protein